MTSAPVALAGTRRAHRTIALQLGALVACSTVIHSLLALSTSAPWIVPDELIYSELAKSMASLDMPAIRGVDAPLSYGLVYSGLIAPAWALFDWVPDAYAAARVVNSLLLSLAALPAYGLARLVVGRRFALLVAVCAVLVPSMAYSGVLMTENAFYGAFLLAALGIARAVERPTTARQLVALGTIALACGVRVQALALVPAYVTALVLHEVLRRRAGAAPAPLARTYRASLVVLALAVLAVGGWELARGSSPFAFLGAYSVVAGSISVAAIPGWFALHAADLSLYVAVAPAAAAVVVTGLGLRRSAPASARLYAAVAPPLVFWTLLLVAAFATETDHARSRAYPGDHSHLFERSTFGLVPLLLLGLAAWMELGTPRPRRLAVGAAVVCGALPAAIPFGHISDNLNFQAPALVPWAVLPVPALVRGAIVALAGLAAALLWLRVDRRRGHLWLLVGGVFVVSYVIATASIANSSSWARDAASGGDAAWIDRAVGPSATVTAVWYEPGSGEFAPSNREQRLVWVNEFFNRTVGDVVTVGARLPYDLANTRAVASRDGTLVAGDGQPIRAALVLARCPGAIAGETVARDRATDAVVVRTDGVVRTGPAGLDCRAA
jgi:hypothetical protein